MAVPRNRHSNARKNTKRAHHAKTPRNLGRCSNCAATVLPHHVCQACGMYAKKSVMEPQS
ncbi:MAG: 50S ribosomal protein L32 [Chlamydiia bacterium]|nr:50S ribosomal protein L32 [Chlamydiia bacterium]